MRSLVDLETALLAALSIGPRTSTELAHAVREDQPRVVARCRAMAARGLLQRRGGRKASGENKVITWRIKPGVAE